MSMGPLGGVIGSAAGTPHSQSVGSETERAKDALAQQRQSETNLQAERAAGIGETGEDRESAERDADGRRLWELPEAPANDAKSGETTTQRQSKDATGQSGTQLDLTG